MEEVFKVLTKSRAALLEKIKTLNLDELNHIPNGFNNNIAWNMGHIVCIKFMLIYGLSNTKHETPEFIMTNFKNKSKPERPYTQEEIDMIFDHFVSTAEKLEADYHNKVFGEVTPFRSGSLNTTFDTIEEIITFNLFHEGIHTGVIQKYIQLIK